MALVPRLDPVHRQRIRKPRRCYRRGLSLVLRFIGGFRATESVARWLRRLED